MLTTDSDMECYVKCSRFSQFSFQYKTKAFLLNNELILTM